MSKNRRPPQAMTDPRMKHIRWLSRWLDSSIKIPGTQYRIGFDPLIGLIPGIGDALAAAMSGYIIILALSLNISAWTLTRMLFNVLLETTIGAIPVLGDFFDAFWKANQRNRILVEESIAAGGRRENLDKRFVVLVLFCLALMISLAIWASVNVLAWLFTALRGLS